MAITSSTSGPTTASVVDIGEGFEDSIANIESLSEDTNAKVTSAQGTAEDNNSKLIAIKSVVDTTDSNVSSIKVTVEDNNDKLIAEKLVIDSTASTVDTIKTTTDTTKSTTDTIKSTTDTIKSTTDTINSNVSSVKGTVEGNSTKLDNIYADTKYINSTTLSGVECTTGSLAHQVEILGEHFHVNERWLAKAATPNAEVHAADSVSDSLVPFTLTAGANTWGSWVCIIGSSDTPRLAGSVNFDVHRVLITSMEKTDAVHVVQAGAGTSGADVLSTGRYSEYLFTASTPTTDAFPVEVKAKRIPVGQKIFARAKVANAGTSNFTFYLGLHEYDC